MLLYRLLCLLAVSTVCGTTAADEIVEVYFICGQSNGGNVGELNSWDPQGYQGLNQADANRTLQSFNLDFARIFDRPSNNPNTDVTEVFHQFSSPMLDPAQFAVDRLALNLNSGSSRMAIYSYCRNGRPLRHTTPGDLAWYPGDDPANGVVFDDELYGHFKTWSTERIAELLSQGLTVDVKAVFWFQGESDTNSVSAPLYETNFQRLIDRFRVDFGSDLKVVGTKIRVVGNAEQQGYQNQVNAGMEAVAATDPDVSVVETQDLPPVDAGNVHFLGEAYYELANRWANAVSTGNAPGGTDYQDSFDNDGLSVNLGSGGGGTSQAFNGAPDWSDDGDLSAGNAGAGFHIWKYTSDSLFNVSEGFTLEVVFDQLFIDNNGSNSTAPFNSNHFSFGLASPNSSSNFLHANGATPEAEAIGVSLTQRFGAVDIGVLEWDLSAGTTTTLNPITSSTVGQALVFTLSVDPAGNYTWSLGNETASGTTNLDLSQLFQFTARTQGSSGNKIRSILLTSGGEISTIPPTSYTRFRGVEVTADLSDFVDSDDVSATFQPGFTLNSTEAPVWLIFDGNDADANFVQLESTANTPGLEYTVEAFNWTTNTFDVIGVGSETFNTDDVRQFPLTQDHVSDGCDLQTRVGWRRTGFTILFPWSVSIDQAAWAE